MEGPAYNPLPGPVRAAVDWCGTFTRTADKPAFAQYAHYYGGSVVPDPKEQAKGG